MQNPSSSKYSTRTIKEIKLIPTEKVEATISHLWHGSTLMKQLSKNAGEVF